MTGLVLQTQKSPRATRAFPLGRTDLDIRDSSGQGRRIVPSGKRAIQDNFWPGGNQSWAGERDSPEPFAFGCVIFNCQHMVAILA